MEGGRHRERWGLALCSGVVAAALLAGCEQGRCVEPELQSGDGQAAIIDGTAGVDSPELGQLTGGCSAELIAPSTAITASHCVGYRSTDDRDQLSFSFIAKTGTFCEAEEHRYRVIAVRAYSPDAFADCQTPWNQDVALVRLETPVPPEVAQPRALATARPVEGDAVTVEGYGCSTGASGARGTKRWRSLILAPGAPVALCSGDSGGALLVGGRDGPIAGVHSSIGCAPWTMIFGDVVGLREQLDAQIAEWNGRYGGP